MQQESLSRITLATIENYRKAANDAAHAYQTGSRRFIDGLNKSLDDRVYSQTSKVAPNLTEALIKVRGRMTQIAIKGIDEVTSRTERAVGMGSDGAATQVAKAARFVTGIDNTMLANGLQVAARIGLPPAKIALAVSSKVAEGAKALSGAAGVKRVGRATGTVAGKTASRGKRHAGARAKRKLA
jgi:hypothetical protein